MRKTYIDQYGNDSLVHIKIASENACDIFTTNNKAVLKDREKLEQRFNIKIRSATEMLLEMGK